MALPPRLATMLTESAARFGALAEVASADDAGEHALAFRPHVLVATEEDYAVAASGFDALAEQVGASIVRFPSGAPDPRRIQLMIADALVDAPASAQRQ